MSAMPAQRMEQTDTPMGGLVQERRRSPSYYMLHAAGQALQRPPFRGWPDTAHRIAACSPSGFGAVAGRLGVCRFAWQYQKAFGRVQDDPLARVVCVVGRSRACCDVFDLGGWSGCCSGASKRYGYVGVFGRQHIARLFVPERLRPALAGVDVPFGAGPVGLYERKTQSPMVWSAL